jgi:putative transposase
VGDENHENGLVSGAIAGREQDHRGIKGRYRPMRGFKCPRSAARFCCAYDELRNFLRPRSRLHQHVPADCQRLLLLRRSVTVLAILQAA